jgi:hypothetical protein
MNRFWFFTGAYLIIFLLSLGVNSYYHEEAHVQDCKYRGGNVTEYELFPNAHIRCSLGPSEIDSFNEAIGYQLGGFYAVIGLMGFLMLMAVLDREA